MKYSTKTERFVRWAIGGLAACLIAMTASGQSTFTQSTPIAITDNSKATPYPSTNFVQNTLGTIEKVTVTLNSVSHGYPDDIDMVLQAPDGTQITLMSDAGGQFDLVNATFTLDSTAAVALPDEGQITSGNTYKPANYDGGDGDVFVGSYSADLGLFNGKSANGTWNLYAGDDTQVDSGSIASWSLNLFLSPTLLITNALPISVAEDVPATINVFVNDSDTPLPNLTLTATSSDASIIANSGLSFGGNTGGTNRTLTVTPVANANGGPVTVTVSLSDGVGAPVSFPITVTVTPVNDAPTLTLVTSSTSIPQGGISTNIAVQVLDIDSDPQGVVLTATSSNPSVIGATNVLFTRLGPIGTPGTNRVLQIAAGAATGSANLTIIATDSSGASSSQTIAVTVTGIASVTGANTTSISIPDAGASTPNPSTITVPNQTGLGLVGKVVVSLVNIEHSIPSDIGVLLVAPSGQSVVLMRGGGGGVPIGLGDTNDVRLAFDKDAANVISAGTLVTDTYRPADFGAGDFPGAPAGPYTTDLNSLQGGPSAGVWKLFVYDSTSNGATGQIAGGWTLQILPAPTLGPIAAQSTPEDTALTLTFPVGDFDGAVTNINAQVVNAGDVGKITITTNVSGTTGTLVITPALNFNTGTPAVPIPIIVIAQDNSGSFTATNIFNLTVTPVNDSPTQTVVPKQVTRAGEFVGPVSFNIGDVESPASALLVTATSDNPKLLPPGSLVLGGTDVTRTITIFPAGTVAGQANITLTVTDPNGGSSTQTFPLTVQDPANELFGNSARIVINDATAGGSIASPYPSTIPVSGLIGKIAEVQVTLFGVTHPTPDDLDILLVGPMGTNIVLLSDAGGANAVTNTTLIFRQSAPLPPDDNNQIVSGIYQPINYEGTADFPFGGSPAATTATLNDYVGANPNGNWTLYVYDDTLGPKGGAIEGGWQLSIRTHSQLPNIPDQITPEDTLKRFTVQIGDVQPGVTNTVTSTVTVPSGQQVILTNGIDTTISGGFLSVSLTPIPDANGTNVVNLTLIDADGFVSTKSFNFIVTPVDDPPRFSAITAKSTPAATPISFTFDVTDPEGTSVSVVGASSDQSLVKDSNISISPANSTTATRTITILPEGVASGSVNITLAATDSTTQKSVTSFALTVSSTLAFQNPGGRIVINDLAVANPYPSTIDVIGVNGTVSGASVILLGFSHPFPDDVDVLLVSPDNKAVMLMSDAGGGIPASNLRLAFKTGSPVVPDDGPLASGSYSPANYVDQLNPSEVDEMPSPAPARPAAGYSTNLGDFAGVNPNGQWKLYVRDDTFPDGGVIEGGWILSLQTAPTVAHVDNQTALEDTVLQVPFSVGDQDTPASGLAVTATVDSTRAPGLIVPPGLSLSTNGFNYVLSILPSTNRPSGTAPETNVITLNVTDGTSAASTTFEVRVVPVDDAPITFTATNRVVTAEDTSVAINFVIRDVDSIIGTSSNVVVLSSNPDLVPNSTNNISVVGADNQGPDVAFGVGVTVTPAANQNGSTILSFIVSDRSQSVTNNVEVDVTSVNDLPTISFPTMSSTAPATNVIAGGTINNIAVTVGDIETPAKNLTVTAVSGNQALIPDQNVIVGGSGADRTVTLTTVGAGTGNVTVSVVAIDEANGKTTNTFVVSITPSPASVFANVSAILIPPPSAGTIGNASPYPSTITVAGLIGNISKISVTLDGLTHSAPDDIDILLVSPSGKKTILLSDVGGVNPISNVRLEFDQTGRALGDDAPIVSGTYQPADFEVGSDTFPSPAPAGPYTSTLQEFLGSDPNGVWSLYIVDDASGNAGQLAFGWSLRIETAPTIVLDPTSLNAPPVSSTYVEYPEDTARDIRFTINDSVTPVGNLAVLFSSSNPNLLGNIVTNLSGNVVTATLLPLTNAFGTNNLTVTVRRSDGAQSSIVVPINVTPVNDPPTVSRFANQTTPADTAVSVPIMVRDVDTALSNIWVRATSTVEGVISSTNILISGRTNFLAGVVANTPSDPFAWTSTITLVPNSISGSSTINIDVLEINGSTTNTFPSSFTLTVTPVNHAPTITSIASPQPVTAGQSSTNIAFSVADTDNDTLTITASSSDQTLVRDADIHVSLSGGGSGLVGAPGGRTVQIATQPGVQGDATITLNVKDTGNLKTSTQFTLRVVASRERVFTNGNQPIQILDNSSANPYPSTIHVDGFSGNISKLTVTLNGFAHTYPDDVDILLVSPTGQKVILMSDAGGGTAVTNLTIKYDDAGTGTIADNSVLTSGSFPPVNFEGTNTDNFASTVPPGPSGPYASTMAAFNGFSPNGDWGLYIIDDTSGDFGVITGGWSIGITTLPVLVFSATDVTTTEDRPVSVDFTIAEESFGNPGSFSFVGSSTNTALVPSTTTNIVFSGSGTNRTVTVIPTANASGTTLINVTEQTSGVTGQFRATFTPVNDLPVITQIGDQTMAAASFLSVTNFNYSDVETQKKDLKVSIASSDSRIIPTNNVAIIGNELRIVSGTGIGTAAITITVTDSDGAATSSSFNVTVVPGQNPLFANTDGIVINDNNKASPYPSIITVSGLAGRVANVSVTLSALTHSYPDDVDILLVGPNGQSVVLMSDAGANGSLVNASLIFDDNASQNLPDNSGIVPFSSYKPTNFEISNSEFASPAPTGPYSVTFNGAFNGIDPNGTWSLYVQDDASPDAGSLGGWSLSITTTAPTISQIGDQVLTEDTAKTIGFTVFDGDTPATNLVVTATQQIDDRGPLLTLDLSGTDTNRSITLTPTPHISGTTRVTVSVTDGTSTNQTTFNVVITPVNDAPVISGLSDTNTPSNIPLRLNFTATDEETPSSDLVLAATSSNELVATVRIDNSGLNPALLFTPTGVSNAIVTVSVVASDGVNFTTNSFNVSITAASGPGISAIPNQTAVENSTVLVAFTITPTSSPNITLSSSFSNPNLVSRITLGGTGINRTALIELVPDRFGFSEIDITVADDFGSATSPFALIVHAVPQPPFIGPILDRSTDENVPVVIDLPVSDPDTPLSALIFAWSASNSNLVANVTFDQTDAAVIATVNLVTNQSGLSAVTIFVSDGTFTTDRSFALNVRPVDNPPSIQPIPDQITNEDVPLTFEIFVSDPDTQLSDITFTGVSSNTNLVSGITFVNSGSNVFATLTLVSNANIITAEGRPTITITAAEGTNSTSRSFLLYVVPVPDAPTLAPIGDQSASAGSTVTIPLVVSDPDTRISGLNFTSQNSNPNLVASIRFNNDGTNVEAVISLLPNVLGTAAITITVTDGTTPVSQSFVLTAKNAAAPAHLAAHLSGGEFNITVTGTPGSTYTIEGTTDLKTWSTLGQVTIDADGSTDIQQVGTFKTYQFFRAKNQ